jgi:potassium-dependent mechanosensitive channel
MSIKPTLHTHITQTPHIPASRGYWIAGCTILILSVAVTRGAAANPAEKPPAERLTVENVQARLKQLDELRDLDEATKGKIQALYQQAVQQLEAAARWTVEVDRFERMTASAASELSATKAEQAAPAVAIPSPNPGESLTNLERALSEMEAKLGATKAQLAKLDAEAKRRATRRAELPKVIAEVRQRLAGSERQQQTVPPADEHPQLAVARRILAAAERRAVEQETASYERELKAYEARAELIPLRRDVTAALVAQEEQGVARWREVVNVRRQQEADAQLRRAKDEAKQASPAMSRLAKRNADWAERRTRMTQDIAKTGQQLEKTEKALADLRDQFARVKEKVEAVGQTETIGLMLRQKRDALPELRYYRLDVTSRQSDIRNAQLKLLEWGDRRAELANLDQQVLNELKAMEPDLKDAGSSELEVAVRETLEAEKKYIVALTDDGSAYFDLLIDLDTAEQLLIKETEDYAKFLDERVLWIPSASVFGLSDARNLAPSVFWFVRPTAWLELARGLVEDARRSPMPLGIAVLLGGLVVYCYRRAKRKIAEIGESAARATCYRVFPTVEALFLTILLAAAWPCVLWHVAWRLNVISEAADFAKVIADGLSFTAGTFLAVAFLYQLCRRGGLAYAHFAWPDANLRILRRYARWTMLLILPLGFVAASADSPGAERGVDSLGRLCFAASLVISSLMAAHFLRPSGGLFQSIIADRPNSWFARLRFLWYPASWLLPLSLAGLSMAGYYYTAGQLADRIGVTACIIWGLVLARSSLLRWVLMRRRNLAMKHARERRAASQAEPRPAADPTLAAVTPAPAAPNLDLATINAQTRHLVEYSLAIACFLALWLAWVDVLPALRGLQHFVIWPSVGQAKPFTLADLGIVAIVGFTTLIAAKNIPGLLEMTLLQRLPFDAGVRYTINTVSRYIITIVGLVSICHSLGVSWDKVQWLVAAISVGLGFGLQEIFANFISGLIILFERPIRVGDVVTVAEVSGVVSRIRMRATTITNWDRKEFIVPNKEFVTGRLLNWTLSDRVNRVVINVGIAYGSDTELATELLLGAAREHPVVLDDPEPSVAFEQFGDSSLNFVLRCYLPDMEKRTATIHDLHMDIDRRFRRAGIEIAFPQRELHLRMSDGSLLPFATVTTPPPPATEPRDALSSPAPSRRVA